MIEKTIEQIKHVHMQKGWQGVYNLLKKEGIEYVKTIADFGLDSNPQAVNKKSDWIKACPANEFRAHLYSQSVTAVKTAYKYNRIRAQAIVLAEPVQPENDTREFPCPVCEDGEMFAGGVYPSGQQPWKCNHCEHEESFP